MSSIHKVNNAPLVLSEAAKQAADLPNTLHNPGYPFKMTLSGEKFIGFSIAALSTYLLMPERNCAFDMGDCPLEAAAIPHVFLTHAHGDHARCLLRHHSLRRLLGMPEAHYYVPESTLEGFIDLAKAWSKLQGGKNEHLPQFVPMQSGVQQLLNRQLQVKAFSVEHTLFSLGYTLYEIRKKLNSDYAHHTGPELAALRKQGVVFEQQTEHPIITFIGDSNIQTLYREQHIGQSRVLFLDMTFLMEGEEELAQKRGHTHVAELAQFLKDCPDVLQNECIVLKHFSMRYQRHQIIYQIKKYLPAAFLERVVVMA